MQIDWCNFVGTIITNLYAVNVLGVCFKGARISANEYLLAMLWRHVIYLELIEKIDATVKSTYATACICSRSLA